MTNKNILYTFLISLITYLFLSFLVVFMFGDLLKHEDKIYVVDVEMIYKDKKEKLKELVLSNSPQVEIEKYKEEYISYAKKVDTYLHLLSEKNHITIFNKKAVFSNSNIIDLTKRIKDEVTD